MASLYNQDPDENRSYQKTVAMCVAAASLVILLFLVILYVNSDTETPPVKTDVASEESKEDDILKDAHNITSNELEFWDDARKTNNVVKDEEEGELTPYKDPNKDKTDDEDADTATDTDISDSKTERDDQDTKDSESADDKGEKSSTDKKDRKRDEEDAGQGGMDNDTDDTDDSDREYLTVKDEYGNKKKYEIIKNVYKNDYDLERDLTNDNGVLSYKDNKREAIKGVDLSKYNGTVDFVKLKENGIGFAMLRLGSRGYGTGAISLDEKFVEYAQNAQLTGIQIGAYFYSQAITEAEAIEEANYIVGAVSGFNIRYPIAIDIEKVSGDEARTDKLTNEQRTAIARAFCDAVKGYGYKPVIYATRDMLISGFDLEELGDYDVWLADDNIPTDYPYRFSMWQYNRRGHIDGITGDIDMNLSFIDYEQK